MALIPRNPTLPGIACLQYISPYGSHLGIFNDFNGRRGKLSDQEKQIIKTILRKARNRKQRFGLCFFLFVRVINPTY